MNEFSAWLKPVALELMTLLARSLPQQSATDLGEAACPATDGSSVKENQPRSVRRKQQRSTRESALRCERASDSAGLPLDSSWRRLPALLTLLPQRVGQISLEARSVAALPPPSSCSGRVLRPSGPKWMSSLYRRSLP